MASPSEMVPAVIPVDAYNRSLLGCLMLATKQNGAALASRALAEGLEFLMQQAAEAEGITPREWFRRRSIELGKWRAGRDVPLV